MKWWKSDGGMKHLQIRKFYIYTHEVRIIMVSKTVGRLLIYIYFGEMTTSSTNFQNTLKVI